jgi:DNA-binding transcriptional ArsR family regulator
VTPPTTTAPPRSCPATLQKDSSVPEPQDPSAGLDALSALARSPQYRRIIRFLIDHPGSYKKQIQEGTSGATSSLGRHLAELESTGIIVGDVPGDDRRGYAVRYTVDVPYVEQLVTQLRTELLG